MSDPTERSERDDDREPDGVGVEDLSRWAADFKRADARPPISADTVLREAARVSRQEKIAWALQVGGLVFAIANFLGIVVWTRSIVVTALSAVVLPTLLGLFGWFVHLRLSTGRRATGSVEAFVAWMARRSEAELSFMRLNRLALAFLATAFWVWLPVFVLSRADKFGAHPARLAIGATFSIVVFAAGFVRTTTLVRRAEAEVARWKGAAGSFDAPRG